MWAGAPNNVVAVGWEGLTLHYDGARWSAMAGGSTKHLTGVWGSSGRDVFAVGFEGTILHYDGAEWSPGHDVLRGRPAHGPARQARPAWGVRRWPVA